MATQPAYASQDDEPAESGAMSDSELAAHLAEHETRAIGYFESEIASEQADALDRYYRRPYGDERAGRSQVVDGTVAITVDNALAAILKPFVSADETVVFEPRSEEDEDEATQATEYVNYVLHQDNCGFQILHDWFKDALLQKVGVVKAYWEDKTREKIVRLEHLDPMQVQIMQQDGSLADGPFGPDEMGLYVCDVKHTEPDGKLCIENVPPEEYRISPFARPGRVPPYEAHITKKARSELIEMGFDREIVEGLSKAGSPFVDQRSIARYKDETWASISEESPGDESRQLVQVNDEYALIDYDGDGVSELRHVIRCNDVILFNEEADYSPFARICPAPMPHKIYGLSLADQVTPEQRIRTALLRQTLDNLYLANNPRPVVGREAERDGGETMEDILSDAPGAVIRAKDAVQLTSFAVPFVADKSFPMLEYIDQQAESRTGISKHGQGMDPDALDTAGQMTATQAAIMEEGRNSRSEMIARIFAETGVKDLFRLMLKIMVQHQPRARMIRLRNKWVEMDPREWNSDMDLSISVGLGMGSKAEQITTAQTVLQTMEVVGQTPFATLIDKEKVYNALKKLYTSAGIKNIDDFLNEPQKDEQGNLIPDPPQPDPKTAEIQAKAEIEQMKAQFKAQSDAQAQQQQSAQAIMSMHLEQQKVASKAQLEQASASFEANLAEQKFAFEARMAMLEHQLNADKAQRDADRQDKVTDAKVQQNREGGDLSK